MTEAAREDIHHCKRCLVCQASLYPELLPPIEHPASLSEAGKWLSEVRALARKSVILSKGDSRAVDVLACVPVDDETLAWALDDDQYSHQCPRHRTTSNEHDQEYLLFSWHDESTQEGVEFSCGNNWIDDLSCIHEACFTILAQVLQRPGMQLQEPCSMADVLAIESLKPSTADVWPMELHVYPDYYLTPILTLDEYWKASTFENPDGVADEERDPSTPAAEIKNRLRIIKRIEEVIGPEIRDNQMRRLEARSEVPDYIKQAYSVDMPQYLG